MLTAEEITTFCDDMGPPGVSPYVPGQRPSTDFAIVAYDRAWPQAFELVATRVRAALSDRALQIEHVGSTAVPGLEAKRAAAGDIHASGGHTNDYNAHKQAVIREIYARAFSALGLTS